MTFNKSGTFVYSPDVRVVIYTQQNGAVDVSEDLTDFNMNRQTNAVSTFQCTLNNPRRKYNRTINTMDRIVVFLKRTTWVQAFAGYVTYAPIETLVPTPVTIQASCTLYQLQMTYWDNTLVEFQQLLLNYMDTAAMSNNKTVNSDGGVDQALVNILSRVAGWDAAHIHVQGIPQNFINFASAAYSNLTTAQNELDQNVVTELSTILGVAGITAGNSTTSLGGSTNITYSGAPAHTTFSASKAVPLLHKSSTGEYYPYPLPALDVINDNNGDLSILHHDIYWCTADWAYLEVTHPAGATLAQRKNIDNSISVAKQWLAEDFGNIASAGNKSGRPIVVSNNDTGHIVVLRATSVPQDKFGNYDPKLKNTLQIHPGVWAYLQDGTDPTSITAKNTPVAGSVLSNINVTWGDSTQISAFGPQIALEKAAAKNIQSTYGTSTTSGSKVLSSTVDKVLALAKSRVGSKYSETNRGLQSSPNASASSVSFDCSALMYWCWKNGAGIDIGTYTGAQFGASGGVAGKSGGPAGLYLDVNTKPQKGDLLFFNFPGVKTANNAPSHVIMLYSDFDSSGNGTQIGTGGPGPMQGPSTLNWNTIKGGTVASNSQVYSGKGTQYLGARRPITLSANYTGLNQNTSGAANAAANANNSSSLNLTNSWNTAYGAPTIDVRSLAYLGTPRSFIMDNPLIADLQQIVGAGLRNFQSAPNGDFVAWFPDYYGIYTTTPTLEISDVEVIDFQIYHDDSQLTTHVGIVGDTTGIGQQVTTGDYLSTNGIVSIQDTSTMQVLFGALNLNAEALTTAMKNSVDFLNKYGMRPYVEEQQMIHTHALEYLYALMVFMKKWTDQFVSQVSLTYMPELYPGMRVKMSLDNESGGTDSYEFYCVNVQHQGSRTSGFTTTAAFTAPIKNGSLLDYGLNMFGTGWTEANIKSNANAPHTGLMGFQGQVQKTSW